MSTRRPSGSGPALSEEANTAPLCGVNWRERIVSWPLARSSTRSSFPYVRYIFVPQAAKGVPHSRKFTCATSRTALPSGACARSVRQPERMLPSASRAELMEYITSPAAYTSP